MNFSDKKTAAAVNCPVCDSAIGRDSFMRVFLSLYNNEEYKLYRCPICHLEFWFPLKVIAEFYKHNTGGLYHEKFFRIMGVTAKTQICFNRFRE